MRTHIDLKNSEERQTKLRSQKFLSHSNNQRTHLKLMNSYQLQTIYSKYFGYKFDLQRSVIKIVVSDI